MPKKNEHLYCNRGDRDFPEIICGYPLPCLYHTVTMDIVSDPPTITIPVVTANTKVNPNMLKKLKDIAEIISEGEE